MLKTSNNNGGKRVIRLSVRSLHVKKNVGEISFTGQEIFNLADLKRKEATLNFHINCGCKGGVRHYFTYFQKWLFSTKKKTRQQQLMNPGLVTPVWPENNCSLTQCPRTKRIYFVRRHDKRAVSQDFPIFFVNLMSSNYASL